MRHCRRLRHHHRPVVCEVKRSQGVRLGRPPTLDPRTVSRIRRERKRGKTLAAIAKGLTADQVPTAHGGRWQAATVRAVLARSAV